MSLESKFSNTHIKNKLREKVVNTLEHGLKNTKSFELKKEPPINLTNFNYLQSNDIIKLKLLCHSSL